MDIQADDWDDDFAGDDFQDSDFPEADEYETDDSELVVCPACGHDIYEDSVRCPICGEYVTHPTGSVFSGRSASWVLLAVAGMIAIIFALIFRF